jgi:hypothetical protein
MYHKRSQPVRVYALRGTFFLKSLCFGGSDVPPELSYEGPEDDTVSRPLGTIKVFLFISETQKKNLVASRSSSSQVRSLVRPRDDSLDDLTLIRPFKRLRRTDSGGTATVGSSSKLLLYCSPPNSEANIFMQGLINPFIFPNANPAPLPKLTTPFSMLMQLDASSNAGLAEAQVRNLFVRCSHYKLYTTTSAFEDHSCRTASTASIEIIDLTGDE